MGVGERDPLGGSQESRHDRHCRHLPVPRPQHHDGHDDDDGFFGKLFLTIAIATEYVLPAFGGISERSESGGGHSGAGERSETLPDQTVHGAHAG